MELPYQTTPYSGDAGRRYTFEFRSQTSAEQKLKYDLPVTQPVDRCDCTGKPGAKNSLPHHLTLGENPDAQHMDEWCLPIDVPPSLLCPLLDGEARGLAPGLAGWNIHQSERRGGGRGPLYKASTSVRERVDQSSRQLVALPA